MTRGAVFWAITIVLLAALPPVVQARSSPSPPPAST